MNSKYLTIEVFCQGCGVSLGTGHRVQNRKFCSNQCQKSTGSNQLLQHWLETGVPKGFTGGQAGNSPTSYIKRYLLTEQNHQCAICGIYDEWYDKPLTLILDHISVDSTDNRRENLRMICPNCDSQTPTFKNRNKGNGRRSKGFSTSKGL